VLALSTGVTSRETHGRGKFPLTASPGREADKVPLVWLFPSGTIASITCSWAEVNGFDSEIVAESRWQAGKPTPIFIVL
jgi:hypothetical protein